MTQKLPQHAMLPLWSDKTEDQKRVTFKSMLDDLNVYRTLRNLKPIEISFSENLDRLMDGYRELFSETFAQIITWLDRAQPADEIEANHISNTVNFINSNPNALNMNCEAGHITGSAIVFDKTSNMILLHKHKKYNRFMQFGGHPDYEFLPIDIAFRETREESNLPDLSCVSIYDDMNIPADVDAHIIPEKDGKPEHTHYDLRYIFQTSSAEFLKANADESSDFQWFEIDQALATPDTIISYPVKRLIGKIKNT